MVFDTKGAGLFCVLPCFFLIFLPGAFSFNVQTISLPEDARISFLLPHGGIVAEVSPTPATAVQENSSFILAANRTYRKDPLDGLRPYSGGWNITNVHYWASIGFTAVPLFAIAAIWLVFFGLTLLTLGCVFCCCGHRRPGYHYSSTTFAFSLIFLILFTVAAIVGCVVLYSGQGKFHNSTTSTLNYVVGQSNLTVCNLRNFSNYMAAAKGIGIDQIFLPTETQTKIDLLQSKINFTANFLADTTTKNSDQIQNILDSVRFDLIIIAVVMLLLVFLGFALSIFGLQVLVYILVVIGWLLVTVTFILSGVFLLLNNIRAWTFPLEILLSNTTIIHYPFINRNIFPERIVLLERIGWKNFYLVSVASDACVSMDEWVQHPTAKTALDDILPCVDVSTANESLYQSKKISSQIVNVINQVVSNISNQNASPDMGLLYYNQSGPLVPPLCNPVDSDLANRQCQDGEVDFVDAPQVWNRYVCQVSSEGGICRTVGRLTPAIYNQMISAVNVSYGLYRYTPFLVQLEDCTFVRDTFSAISSNECPGLRKYSQRVYVGLVIVSVAVMLSLIFWVIHAQQRRHRKYSKLQP